MPQVLTTISGLIGTIPLGFGINALIRPEHAITFFNNSSMPTANRSFVDALLMIYAIRDIFMGIAIYATAYYGSKRALGWIMLAGCACAVVDGLASKMYLGGGEWDHWGYSPILGTLGLGLALF
jgi:hypothetical protein